MADSKLPKLLYYVKRGWPIFPVTWIQDGVCSCGAAGCQSPGKHPLTKSGFYDASVEPEQVRAWHNQFPRAGWALRTGAASAIVAIDLDNHAGKANGLESWERLREEHPEAVETITVSTRSGGRHLWFTLPEGESIDSRSGIWPGIDVKADRGYVVVPPSEGYQFVLSPNDAGLAELPEWISEHLQTFKKKPDITVPAAGKIPEGGRHQALIEAAAKMRNAGLDDIAIEAALTGLRDQQMEPGAHQVTDEEVEQVLDWIKAKDRRYAPTDLGNAERFIAMHHERVRYCAKWNQWVAWDGKRWKIDEDMAAVRAAHAAVRAIYFEVGMTKDDEERKAMARHARQSESKYAISAMLDSAKPYLPILPDELDKQPGLVNVRNGVVDLATGTLLPHDPALKLSKMIDVEFDPGATCERWEAFIKMVCGGDDKLEFFLQVATGYSLTGYTDEHAVFMLYGLGRNGKSTFTKTLHTLFGEYATRTDVEALLANFKNGDAANPYIAGLKGIRLALATEMPENRKLNESLLKDLTGGDVITGRFLFGNPFTFEPTHKLWMVGNYKPKIRGNDVGIWRRIRVVPFLTTIPNPRPMSEVLDEFKAELPGILNWAVLGAIYWHQSGLELPDMVMKATAEYKSESDLIGQFIDRNCTMQPEGREKRAVLFLAWQNWCTTEGEEDAGKRGMRWFTTQLQKRGVAVGGHGDEYYIGLILNGG